MVHFLYRHGTVTVPSWFCVSAVGAGLGVFLGIYFFIGFLRYLQVGEIRAMWGMIASHQHHNYEYLRRRGFIFSSGFKSGTTW